MILPIRTNIWPHRTPYTNYALIAINVVIFLVTYSPHTSWVLYEGTLVRVPEALRNWANGFMLNPANRVWYQFITYAFLHGGWVHIIGNMYFLYLFGNNVCDKLGTIKYLLLYFAGAVFAAVGQIVLTSLYSPDSIGSPLLGASGAIATVTGAYLVLFPQTYITIIYWFFIIGTFDIPAHYFILFKLIILDNLIDRFTTNIAYEAHLAGYAFGIATAMVILATGLVRSSGFDLLAMLKQWNRRRKFRDVVATGYDPFTNYSVKKKIEAKEVAKSAAQSAIDLKILQLRSEINSRIIERKLPSAAELYLELMQIDNTQVLPQPQMLDIANQLASEGKHRQASEAYEKFIKQYSSYEYIGQVQLMLGLIYSRYLNQAEGAINILQQAEKNLTDAAQIQMCRDELTKLQT
jgi:membrane associated rhomboid family serine protease